MFIIFVVYFCSLIMSPRPVRLRKISSPPVISGFKPYGNKNIHGKTENVFLYLEEYESIRLCDYEMMNQYQASVIMDVSRPTLTRIYAKARQKIAEAFVKGKQIIIEGGKIYFDSEWFHCITCGCYFNNPEKLKNVEHCPLCRSKEIINCDLAPEEQIMTIDRCDHVCVCHVCGFRIPHSPGNPCNTMICPECGNRMAGDGFQHHGRS